MKRSSTGIATRAPNVPFIAETANVKETDVEAITKAAARGVARGTYAAQNSRIAPEWLSGEWSGESIGELLGDLYNGDEHDGDLLEQDICDAYCEAADTAFDTERARLLVGCSEYVLPASWASYLCNGDASGLEDGEQEAIDQWYTSEDTRCQGIGDCTDVSEDTEFSWHNDANSTGGDVATFTFYRHPTV